MAPVPGHTYSPAPARGAGRGRVRRSDDDGDEEAPSVASWTATGSSRGSNSRSHTPSRHAAPGQKRNKVAAEPVAEQHLRENLQQHKFPVAEARLGKHKAKEDELSMSKQLPPLPVPPHAVRPPPDYVLTDARGRVPIRVRVHVMSLHSIDTVNQTFCAKLWIQLAWVTHRRDLTDIDFSTEWKPRIEILDTASPPDICESQVPRPLECNDPEQMIISCRWVINGCFSEKMELENFPMDYQKLHIRAAFWDAPSYQVINPEELETSKTVRRAYDRALKFYRGQSFVYEEAFVQSDAYDLDPKLYIEQDYSRHERHDFHQQMPVLSMFLLVERRSSYYMYNIVFPIFMLVVLSFISFLFEDDDLEPKMTVSLTIVLTLVAVKLVVAQYLPTTSYLTKLDWYVVLAFAMTFLTAAQNALIYYLRNEDNVNDVAWVSSLTLVALWGVLNIIMCVMAAVVHYKKISSLSELAYRDNEARALPLIDSPLLDHKRFPFPHMVDRSDRVSSGERFLPKTAQARTRRRKPTTPEN